MYCHICGKEITSSSTFCCYCGTAIPHLDKHKIYSEVIEESKVYFTEGGMSYKERYTNIASKCINTLKSVFLGNKKYILLLLLPLGLVVVSHNTKTDNIKTDLDENNTTSESYETEEERWDAENGVYANFKYGIAFNLTRGVKWVKISGTAKHTVVKFMQPDLKLIMFANIHPIETDLQIENIWDVYDEYIDMVKTKMTPNIFDNDDNNGTKLINAKHEKSEICGKQAIKTIYQTKIEDDRYNEDVLYTTVGYTIIHNNSFVMVSVRRQDKYIDLLLEKAYTLDFFLRSFQLTPTNTNHINN